MPSMYFKNIKMTLPQGIVGDGIKMQRVLNRVYFERKNSPTSTSVWVLQIGQRLKRKDNINYKLINSAMIHFENWKLKLAYISSDPGDLTPEQFEEYFG